MAKVLWFRELDDWAALVAPALVLPSGLLAFGLFHDFPPFSPALLIAWLWLVLAGLALGLVLSAMRSKLARSLIFGLLLIFYLDVQFDFIRFVEGLGDISDFSILRLGDRVIAIGAVFGLVVLLRRHLSTILLLVFGVIFVSTLFIPPKPAPYGQIHSATVESGQSDLPTIVHIVLDGHIGPDGIPSTIAGGPALRRELIDFYVGEGFRVYGRAYSQYMESILSLSALLNGGDQSFADLLQKRDDQLYTVEQNAYFEELAARGHPIRVYETDYLVYCGAPGPSLESCYRVTASSVRPVGGIEVADRQKAKLLLAAYFQSSKIYSSLAKLYDKATRGRDFDLLPPRVRRKETFSPLEAPRVFDRLVDDIESAPPGHAFFAHIMLPHEPYIYDSDCAVRGDLDQWLGRRFDFSRNGIGTPAERVEAYELYFLQVRCAMRSLSRVFAALKEAGLWERSTIVLHGDHGSRIALRDPIEAYLDKLTEEDLVDAYSTFFAIRSPGVAPGYDPRSVSVQDLFAEFFLRRAPKPDDGVVYAMRSHAEAPPKALRMAPIGSDESGVSNED
ncbi:MAG: hypothetical protein AAF495_01330 [Pseudomonadota bacterium]